jgi:hypothetical protein
MWHIGHQLRQHARESGTSEYRERLDNASTSTLTEDASSAASAALAAELSRFAAVAAVYAVQTKT